MQLSIGRNKKHGLAQNALLQDPFSRFLFRPYPSPLLLVTIIGTQIVAVLIAHFGWNVAPISWEYIGMIWAYCLVWVFIEDGLKLTVYRRLEQSSPRHRHFLAGLRHSMHFHSKNHH